MRITILALGMLIVLGGPAVALEGAGSDDLQVRAFDLLPLTDVMNERPTAPLGFLPLSAPGFLPVGSYDSGYEFDETEPAGFFDVDEILEMVQSAVESGPDAGEEASVQVLSSNLVVRMRAEPLDRIGALLGGLERWSRMRIPVRVYLLEGADPAYPPGVLEPAQCRAILAGGNNPSVQAAFEGLAIPGQRTVLGRIEEMSYVSDYDVEVAQSACIAAPIVRVLRHGIQIEAEARVLNSGGIAIDLATSRVRPELPMRRERTRAEAVGDIELPALHASRIGLRTVVPDGGGVLAWISQEGADAGGWILVTAGPTDRDTIRVPWWGDEQIGVFPIGFLTAPRGGFAALTRELDATYRSHRFGPQIDDGAEDPELARESFLGLDEICEGLFEHLLHAGVTPSNDNPELLARRESLVVRGSGELLDRVAEYLEGLEALRSRAVSVDARLHRIARDDWATIRERLARNGTGGSTEGPWTVRADAAGDIGAWLGGDTVARMGVSTLHGVSAGGFCGIERAILSDYAVEIAQAAKIADPLVEHAAGGFALGVTPVLDTPGARVHLRLRGEWSRFDLGSVESFGAPNIGAIDRPVRESLGIRLDPVLQPGEGWIHLLEERGDEGVAWVLYVRVGGRPGTVPMRAR